MQIDHVFNSSFDFEHESLAVFRYQSERSGIYRDYIRSLNIDLADVNKTEDIPFLPISFFKTHTIVDSTRDVEAIFTSSGTSGLEASRHFVNDLDLYIKSFTNGFRLFYGDIKKYCLLALLPSYLERSGSSLVYMCDQLIDQSNHPSSGFYLDNFDALADQLKILKAQHQPVILLGVTYALLDLAEKFPFDFRELIIIETGGMKGKRKEMVREEVHSILQRSFNTSSIHSEYGMTELLSQAWSKANGVFNCPPWMRIYIRDVNDPFHLANTEVTGAVNIIDLANINSCSFIATDDIGRLHDDHSFEILGRLESSDLRGCNLLVD